MTKILRYGSLKDLQAMFHFLPQTNRILEFAKENGPLWCENDNHHFVFETGARMSQHGTGMLMNEAPGDEWDQLHTRVVFYERLCSDSEYDFNEMKSNWESRLAAGETMPDEVVEILNIKRQLVLSTRTTLAELRERFRDSPQAAIQARNERMAREAQERRNADLSTLAKISI